MNISLLQMESFPTYLNTLIRGYAYERHHNDNTYYTTLFGKQEGMSMKLDKDNRIAQIFFYHDDSLEGPVFLYNNRRNSVNKQWYKADSLIYEVSGQSYEKYYPISSQHARVAVNYGAGKISQIAIRIRDDTIYYMTDRGRLYAMRCPSGYMFRCQIDSRFTRIT